MNWLSVWRRQRALIQCAPLTDTRLQDRPMRIALFRTRKNRQTAEAFSYQQAFDRAVTALVRAIPVPAETAGWFVNEKLVAPVPKRGWKKTARDPVVVAICLALAVILGIGVHIFLERLNDFPGSATARKLLTVASSTRVSQLDRVQTDAGELADLFFMKYRLEHYDVPAEFARFRTIGCRVFEDDEGHQVAQIEVGEKRMHFFLFPAEKQKKGRDSGFSGWRYVDQEGWVGAVQQRHGVCFMAALRGRKKDLATYLPKTSE
jgi:hypothetical protein